MAYLYQNSFGTRNRNINMVIITFLEKIGKDDRGYTYEYFHERYGRHLIAFRKAGSISGRHYHKGISLTKDPEILILCSGRITVNWRSDNGKEQQSRIVEGPAKIEIPVYTWHEIIAETDATFLEMNSLSEHSADTFHDDPAPLK